MVKTLCIVQARLTSSRLPNKVLMKLGKSNLTILEHVYQRLCKSEFIDKNTYMKYKLEELKKTNNKIEYEITFNLIKKDGIWIMDNLTEIDRKKIHGLY